MSDGLVGPEEAAKILDVHVETVRRWVRKGLLKADFQVGKVIRFSRLSLLDAATIPDAERNAAAELLSPEELVQIIEALKPIVEEAVATARAARMKKFNLPATSRGAK